MSFSQKTSECLSPLPVDRKGGLMMMTVDKNFLNLTFLVLQIVAEEK